MNTPRPSWLISSVGWLNVLIGLVFVGFGIYVLIAGAEAVATLFQFEKDVGKAAQVIGGKDNAKEAKAAAGVFAKGMSGVILAFAFVVAGCSIVQGLPNLLIGVGVILRYNVARVFALVFAVLALLEGLAFFPGMAQNRWLIFVGLALVTYAILTFVALLGKRASLEFSGGAPQAGEPAKPIGASQTMSDAQPIQNPPAQNAAQANPILMLALVGMLVASTGTAAVFATLYFTTKPAVLDANPGPLSTLKDQFGGVIKTPKATDKKTEPQPGQLDLFHKAVLAGQIPRAAQLLKEIDVDEPDEKGRTALMKVAANGNIRSAMFLLAMGARLDQRDHEGATPFILAADNNQVDMLKFLYQPDKQTLADIAILRQQYKAGIPDIKALTDGAFVMPSFEYAAKDKRGHDALMRAMLKHHFEATRWLNSEAGSRFDTQATLDLDGNTIIHLLAKNGDKILLERYRFGKGFQLDDAWLHFSRPDQGYRNWQVRYAQQNVAGKTEWMVAAENGHLEIMKHLMPIKSLAELDRKDRTGKTGQELAAANNHKEVVAYLTKLRTDLTPKVNPKDKK